MAWLAIDAGTSVIKSVLFADDGHELALARQSTRVLHPHTDWSEQDMAEVWSAIVTTVRQIAPGCAEPMRGIVSTAQGDGCWLVDQDGRPTGNAILWNDGRAASIVQGWHEQGKLANCFRITGSVTYPGLLNALLAWLRTHQPERLASAHRALTCNGWIFAQLTGQFAADLSDASNPFGDVRTGAYSTTVIDTYAAQQDASLLPSILAGRDSMGTLRETAAKEFGLEAGLPVVMAPYDIIATAYGSGAALAGDACVILGTTICAEVFTASLDLAANPQGTTIALHDGLFLRAMPTLTGCQALDWAAKMLGLNGIPELDTLASQADPGGTQPLFLPYLSPAGERSPFLAPEARGSFHGLTLATTRAEIARSVYEGLSFVIRECLEAAALDPLNEIRVCGGGARSDLWCQMIADVLGVHVVRVEGNENGARGAHLFALFATGAIASIKDGIDRHIVSAQAFHSSPAANQLYTQRFRVFRDLRDLAREPWRWMASLP